MYITRIASRRTCCITSACTPFRAHASTTAKATTAAAKRKKSPASTPAAAQTDDVGEPQVPTKMKRASSASSSGKAAPKAKKARPEVPEYHLTPSRTDEAGEIIWPAPKDQMERAKRLILECATSNQKTLLVPDKDADGLSSGAILQKTLIHLGLSPSLITVHLIQKGANVHAPGERAAMAAHAPAYVFVLDQGTRKAPPVIDAPHKALIIDHHHAASDADFPEGAAFVTACRSPPVATTSLLTYLLCRDLLVSARSEGTRGDDEAAAVADACAWLCALGTHGDLGTTTKWEPPFPCMRAVFKAHTKKAVNDGVALVNAPRRGAAFAVRTAWDALSGARSPKELAGNAGLQAARQEVAGEVERCARAPPRFSADGRIAVLRVASPAQVHPVIATRWAGYLASPALEVVLVANEGYLPGLVNFSCRVPRCARAREPPVNIIEVLEDVAGRAEDPTLRERLGESFARGHKEASGGIVGVREFEELMACLRVGEKAEGESSPRKKRKQAEKAAQTNTLMNYLGKENGSNAA